ncbi:TonB-dependent siderophore receptor [Sphingobium chlorophenolicum L-1]|uniref:TonB-dependent siderophore receptor n=1 Tax=Sphingobium chlorophenolicum L-1 TaxID=690566 RepID=F6EUG1_SPHCR|nr:TonB-dependent siderophore receptor [Sphingobium chlorophenolicum]AEG47855.1 TonB-dependent siderophore receptor [Sphingobium chlorophenolicum L-1]
MPAYLCAGTALAALLACPAMAQNSGPVPVGPGPEAGASQEGDILVTGQRQAYRGLVPMADIPQAITLLTEARLEDAQITRLADALDLSSSVARQNNFGGLWESFAIRGLVGDENNPSGYLVNGFNAGRGFAGPRDVSGIERIEILKGPNAALFGRGEPGGSINLVTKRPTATLAGKFEGTYGSFDFRRIEGDANVPATDFAAFRLVGFYEAADSFRDTIKSERYGVFPSVLLRFGPRTSLTYELEATRQEIPLDRGVFALGDNLKVIPQSRFLGEPGLGPNVATALGHQFQLQHDFSNDWSLLVGVGLRDTELKGTSADAELAVARQRLFVDGRTLTREVRYRDYDGDHKVYRAELSGRFEGPLGLHRVIVGADRDAFDQGLFVAGYRAPLLSTSPTAQQGFEIDILNPVYGRFSTPALSPINNRTIEQRSWGTYLQDQIRISDRVEVRVGARYDEFSQTITNRINSTVARQSESRISPQAGIVWKLSEPINLYAAYGEGFRPNTGASVSGDTFDPETSRSIELGAKLSAGGMTATASLFELRKANILTSDIANPGFSIAVGKVRSRGAELELSGRLPGAIDVLLSYTYLDAEVISGTRNVNGVAISPGDRLLNVPKHTLSAQASRAFPVAGCELKLGGAVLHVSSRLGEVGTTFELPAYTTVRLFGSYALTENIEASIVVSNLFDTTYFVNSYARLWVQPGAPRTALATLKLRL